MTLNYEFTLDDWLEFNRYHLQHSPTHQRIRTLVRLIFIPFGIIFTALRWMKGQEFLGPLLIYTIMATIWFFLYPMLFDRRVIRTVKRMINEGDNRGLLGEHTLETSPGGFRITYPGGETFHKWSSVVKVCSTPDYIFIYTTALQATVIPRRSLRDDVLFGEALAEVQNHVGS